MADPLYTAAIDQWGEDAQVLMVCEELGELLSVLSKHRRGRVSRDEVLDELADATIMVQQAAVLAGVPDEDVAKRVRRKRGRLARRLGWHRDDCATCGRGVYTPTAPAGEVLCELCEVPS